jgi:hypothetical protein
VSSRLLPGGCASLLAIVLWLPAAAAAPDDRAVQMLQTAREAVGGEAALAAVDALTASGELSIPGSQGGNIVIDLAPPDRFRSVQRLLFPMIGSADVSHALNGDIAWTDTRTRVAMPGAHVDDIAASEDELRRVLQSELGAYALAWLLRPAGAFQQPFEHDPEIEHGEAGKSDVLRSMDEGGHALRLFLDPRTHRPTQIRYWGRTDLAAHATSRFVIGPGARTGCPACAPVAEARARARDRGAAHQAFHVQSGADRCIRSQGASPMTAPRGIISVT